MADRKVLKDEEKYRSIEGQKVKIFNRDVKWRSGGLEGPWGGVED